MPLKQKILRKDSYDRPINVAPILPVDDWRRKFICPEESARYSLSLQQLVFSKFRKGHSHPTIIEFGSGTGEPVISAMIQSRFQGTVHGYEINPEASDIAERLIDEHGLSNHYIIHNMSFFESQRIPPSDYLIANPPYLPCSDKNLLILPDLCGGEEGNEICKQLLSAGYTNVFLEISSYSNPKGVIEHAANLNYKITDFIVSQLPFGIYSRQDIIQKRIGQLKEEGKAFFSENCYLVGSAFFTKESNNAPDLSFEFLSCLSSVDSSKSGS